MNRRHRRAQYASRASVLLNTFMMVKEKPEPSLPAIVIGIRSNGIQVCSYSINKLFNVFLQVMVPKFGLESVIYLNDAAKKDAESGQQQRRKSGADQRNLEQMVDFCTANGIRLFQEVKVSLSVVERGDQRKRIDVRLVEPQIEGFSIVTDCETDIPA